jgi:uncharacterized damage-inducible protein DinB
MQASLAQALEGMHERLAEAVLRLDQEALFWRPAPGLPTVSDLLAQVAAEEHRWIAEALAGTPAGLDTDNWDVAEQEGVHPLFRLGSTGQFSQVILNNLAPGEWALERRLDDRRVTVATCILHVLEELARTLGQIEIMAGLWAAHRP